MHGETLKFVIYDI